MSGAAPSFAPPAAPAPAGPEYSWRSDLAWAGFFFLLALGLELALLPWWRGLPFRGDEEWYWEMACRFARGELVPEGIFLRPPLWPRLLSLAALFSEQPLAGRIFSSFLMAAMAPLLYFLGRRAFSHRVGLAAALFCAVYPECVGYGHYLFAEPLQLFLGILATHLLLDALARPNRRGLAGVFALLGLAWLAKETAVLLAAAALFAAWRAGAPRRRLLLGALLFSAPGIAYSAAVSAAEHRLFLLADAPFYSATQRNQGDAALRLSPGESKALLLRQPGQRLRDAALRYPREFANLWTPNSFICRRLLNPDPARNYRLPRARAWAVACAGAYVALMVLGLTGMILGPPSPLRNLALAYPLLLCLSGAVFWFLSRYRLPLLYLFILHAALLLTQPRLALAALRDWRARPLAVACWALALILFGIVVVARWPTLGQRI